MIHVTMFPKSIVAFFIFTLFCSIQCSYNLSLPVFNNSSGICHQSIDPIQTCLHKDFKNTSAYSSYSSKDSTNLTLQEPLTETSNFETFSVK